MTTTVRDVNLRTSTAEAPAAISDNSSAIPNTAWIQSLIASFAPGANSVTLPGGLIIKWGLTAAFDTGPSTTTFPVAFPTSCFSVMITQNQDFSATTRLWEVGSLTRTSFSCRNDGNGQAFWFAIGK